MITIKYKGDRYGGEFAIPMPDNGSGIYSFAYEYGNGIHDNDAAIATAKAIHGNTAEFKIRHCGSM